MRLTAGPAFWLAISLGVIKAVHAEEQEVDQEILSAILSAPPPAKERSWDPDCKAVKEMGPPKADLPSGSEKVALKGCDPRRLYYGLGGAEDPVQARKCALSFQGQDDVFTSEAVLMMIYANGLGVKRNVPLAMHYACRLEAIAGEMEGRMDRLRSMQTEIPVERFDLCQDAVGSFTEGKCSSLNQEKIAARRDAEMKKLTSGWSPLERKAFQELRKLAEVYAETRSAAETDLSGYGKASAQSEKEGELLNEFLLTLESFEDGKLPQGGKKELERVRRELEESLKKILRDDAFFHGTVEKDDIRETQRKWEAYRDAWVRFGSIRYPKVNKEAWDFWATQERLRQLKSLTRYDYDGGESVVVTE